MANNNFLTIFCLVLTILLAIIQVTAISSFGIKPNLALIGLIISAVFINSFWLFLCLTAVIAFILKFQPGFDLQIMVFLLIALIIYLLIKYSSWQPFLSINVFVLIFTATFYLLTSSELIFSSIFLKELVYNVIIANFILMLLWPKTKKST
ncbi:MAG: hypothetical protein WC297_01890 [Candidatus Paceibacterota bacterium]|jgi:hypothetical protein